MGTSFLKEGLARFRQDDEGNVAMIAALSVIPILSVVGLAMDLQLTSTQRAGVQAAVDSAVIAGAKSLQAGSSQEEIAIDVNNYVAALISQNSRGTECNSVMVTVGQDEETIDASVSCTQKTTLSHVFGRKTMAFNVRSGSAYGVGDVEVAMVFDVSGSMNDSNRMTSLKAAANDALDVFLPKDASTGTTPGEGVLISMTSYDHMINADEFFEDVTGLKPKRKVDVEYEECTKVSSSSGKKKKGKGKGKGGSKTCEQWETKVKQFTIESTCVAERGNPEAFTDVAPGKDAWIEPAQYTVKTKYNSSTMAAVPTSVSVDSCNPYGPQPLTNDRGALDKYVKDLEPHGGTAGHMGFAWGWYSLSPNWKNVWPSISEPAEYNSGKTTKAIIMMTDGAFLHAVDNSLGTSSEQAVLMCDAIKDEGILIYTVAFQAPKAGKDTLKACATSDEYAYEPKTTSELSDAYTNIARSISDLRISH